MSAGDPPADGTEELFEDAPCGYLTTRPDGTIVRVNRTFERWLGMTRQDLVQRRFQDLLSPGGRIYHETHYAPLLQMQGSVHEIAVEIVRADGSRLPALINSVLVRGDGTTDHVRTTVFDATDRRRYEQELLRSQRREHEIALQLQRSLLAGALPQTPALALDVAYRPADAGLEVGGDWYDAFWLDEGASVALVVGDVVGRGLASAATMGQLRSAVRALAATGLGPAALLRALDAYSSRHQVGQMATLVYAELTIASRELRFACAGHPPPAVGEPGKEPAFLWGGRSTPLDTHLVTPGARTEDACVLAPGSILLLYTDGLVERQADTLAQGMSGLLEQLAARSSQPGLANALVDALRDSERADDMCLLAARLEHASTRAPMT
jgi:PAS domain S-box-containing protein